MVGSPNYVPVIYDGDDSDASAPVRARRLRRDREAVRRRTSTQRGAWPGATDFSGRSDYGAVHRRRGIPAGGLFTGAEGIKTAPSRPSSTAARRRAAAVRARRLPRGRRRSAVAAQSAVTSRVPFARRTSRSAAGLDAVGVADDRAVLVLHDGVAAVERRLRAERDDAGEHVREVGVRGVEAGAGAPPGARLQVVRPRAGGRRRAWRGREHRPAAQGLEPRAARARRW